MVESYSSLPLDPVSLLLAENPGRSAKEIVAEKVADLQRTMYRAGAIGTTPPFSPDRIARQLGISVKNLEDKDLGFEACLLPLPGDRWKILVNTTGRSDNRRRFSLAHELVHTLFPEAETTAQFRLKKGFDPDQELENLVDFGAAQLLMPPKLFGRDLATKGASLDTLFFLSSKYQVSLQATALNMLDLSSNPQALVFCTYSFRPSSEPNGTKDEKKKWRVQRAFTSSNFPVFLYKGLSFPDTSLVERVARVGKPLTGMVAIKTDQSVEHGFFAQARTLNTPRFEPPTVLAFLGGKA